VALNRAALLASLLASLHPYKQFSFLRVYSGWTEHPSTPKGEAMEKEAQANDAQERGGDTGSGTGKPGRGADTGSDFGKVGRGADTGSVVTKTGRGVETGSTCGKTGMAVEDEG
jgi:hypothetical protein